MLYNLTLADYDKSQAFTKQINCRLSNNFFIIASLAV